MKWTKIKWDLVIPDIKEKLQQGITIKDIGTYYGVSKQRIYQVMTKYGLSTIVKHKANFLRDKGHKYYWLNKMLTIRGVPKEHRLELLDSLVIPDYCPMLGMELNYHGVGDGNATRSDNSPSMDRIDSNIGYEKGNLQIISWRANRIKNDSTPEELLKIAKYMLKLTNI